MAAIEDNTDTTTTAVTVPYAHTYDYLPTAYIPPAIVETGGLERHLSPMNQPIPLPSYLPDGWTPDWEELDKPTPKDYRRKAVNESTGELMYFYVPTAYMIKVINRTFRHQWGLELVHEEWGDWEERKNQKGTYRVKPYTCIVQLVAPTMFRPVVGVGTSYFFENNSQESQAKTRNGALTAAFKSCCKQLGVGRDVEEDDPEVAKVVNDRHRTIQMMFDELSKRDLGKESEAVITKHAPSAMLGGSLMVTAIDFELLEVVQRELSAIAVKASAKGTPATVTIPAKVG